MVEYGILVAGIAVVVMAVVFVLGGAIDGLFQTVIDRAPLTRAGIGRERASDDARSRRPRPVSCRSSEEFEDVQIQA